LHGFEHVATCLLLPGFEHVVTYFRRLPIYVG